MTASFRFQTVCIDCSDANLMADFYSALLGWDVTLREPNWALIQDPAGGAGLSFQAEADYREPTWPEQAARQDKMMHLDIKVDDLDAAVARASELGARLTELQPHDHLRVMLDPSGHPFCLFLH